MDNRDKMGDMDNIMDIIEELDGKDGVAQALALAAGIRNAKSLADMDEAFRALSEAAGADGESYRYAHGGRHRFDIGRAKTNQDSLEDWGPKIAEAAGCRVKAVGFSDDRTLVQGYLDADNWALDAMGIAQPYADGSFDELPGAEHRPSWMPPPPPPPAKPVSAPAPVTRVAAPEADAQEDGDPPEEAQGSGRRERRPRKERIEEPERATSAARLPPGAALGLARALVECGIDPDELMLALARVSRDLPDGR